MMRTLRYSNTHLLLAAGVGAVIGYGALTLTANHSAQVELKSVEKSSAEYKTPAPVSTTENTLSAGLDIEQLRKDLSTRFIGDPRNLGEKLHDFTTENSTPLAIAIACKVVADLAENPAALDNQELSWLYQKQKNTELKRVVAQVLSLRGDNSLMELLINEAQPALSNRTPAVRRKALVELAKTHYAGVANAILSLLQDEDINVKLDALLTMRATGNESHIHALKNLQNHSDESVSWLAKDAISHLQNLSSKARSQLISADITAELPPIHR